MQLAWCSWLGWWEGCGQCELKSFLNVFIFCAIVDDDDQKPNCLCRLRGIQEHPVRSIIAASVRGVKGWLILVIPDWNSIFVHFHIAQAIRIRSTPMSVAIADQMRGRAAYQIVAAIAANAIETKSVVRRTHESSGSLEALVGGR